MANIRESIKNTVNSILKPESSPGISGWVFDVSNDESLTMSADITDHVTEDNSFIQDHITIKPDKITLTGLIGELVKKEEFGVQAIIQDLQSRLQIVTAYTGQYTPPGFQEIALGLNAADSVVGSINQSIDRIKNTISWILSIAGVIDTRQQKAMDEIRGLMKSKQLFTVQTPWGYYESMAIETVTASQGDDSKSYSTFSVTLKEMRFASIETTAFDENLFPQREEMQKQDEADQGNIKGQNKTMLLNLAEAGGFGG